MADDDFLKQPEDKSKKTTEELMKEMDDAAIAAGVELTKEYANWSARDLVVWWAKWYLKAGHKRLGRILVAKSKGK